jgi:hypothetical protein
MSEPTTMVIVTLNAKLGPMDRGEAFEDPLHDRLQALGLGETTGGGSFLDPVYGSANCDIEVLLTGEATPDVLDLLVAELEALGAPKGSSLAVEFGGETREFGTHEGLALWLNGTDLPDDVYDDTDIGAVVASLSEAVSGVGRFAGSYNGPENTALFFYGPSFSAMDAALAPVRAGIPICQGSRVEQIA